MIKGWGGERGWGRGDIIHGVTLPRLDSFVTALTGRESCVTALLTVRGALQATSRALQGKANSVTEGGI